MGLDPNDLRLKIEAEVSAPGALEAAEQIRDAGRAADETSARFERLRDARLGRTEQVGAEPLPSVNVPAAPAPLADLPQVRVQPPPAPILQARAEALRSAPESALWAAPPRPPTPPVIAPPAPTPQAIPAPRPTAPASAAPDPATLNAATQAQAGLTRSVSDGALATARAAGATNEYLQSVRAVANAVLAQNAAETETNALRIAAANLGTPKADAERLFPDPVRQGTAAIDPNRVRAALASAGLNGRTDAETTRITAEAEHAARVEQLRAGLQQAGIDPAQARREAARLTAPAAPATASAQPQTSGESARTAARRATQAFEQAGIQTQDPAERTRRSVEGLDEPLQRAEHHAGSLASLFDLSNESVTRAGLSLFGVGAGLNALVTVASRVHHEISAAVDAQEQLALRTRETTAIYGRQQGGQVQAQATAFTANPQTRGSEQDYLAAAASLHGLSAEYGLSTEQVGRLATAAGQLARIHNTELAPAVQAVQGVLRGNVEAGQQYGITLTDEYGRIRGLGATYEQLVGIYGRARAEQILYQQVLQQTAAQQSNAAGPVDSTTSALDRLRKSSDLARESLAHLAEQPFNVAVNFLARIVGGLNSEPNAQAIQNAQVPQQRYSLDAPSPVVLVPPVAAQPARQPGAAAGGLIDSAANAGLIGQQFSSQNQAPPAPVPGAPTRFVSPTTGQDLTPEEAAKFGQQLMPANIPPLLPSPAPTPGSGTDDASRKLAESAGTVTAAFDQVSQHLHGDLLPALERLGSTQQLISGVGTIEQALRGPDAQLTGGDIQRRAAAQAAQDVYSQQQQRDAQQYDPLVNQARQVAPEEFDRREAARTAQLQAGQAQTFAGRAQAEAQAGVTSINLVDQQRQLDAAGDLARLRTEALGREGNIVDLQRQEADLADRQRVAARENLDLLEAQTRARLDSLQAVNQLNDLQYQERHTATEITAIRADVRRGALDPAALEAIPALRLERRAERLATPRAELNAQEAQRPGELIGRAQTQDELNRTLRTIPLQREQRGLEDQLLPQQEAQRLTEERTQELNRQLEIARLAEEPQRSAAERNVLAATAVSLAADIAARRADEWAAGIHNGLTDIERAWVILKDLPAAPLIIGPQPIAGSPAPEQPKFTNPTPDRQPDPALTQAGISTPSIAVPGGQGGAGAAQVSTTSIDNGTFNITVQVGGSNASPAEIGRAVLQALNGRTNRAPSATPRTMVGAR
jgi:hypothetical protein